MTYIYSTVHRGPEASKIIIHESDLLQPTNILMMAQNYRMIMLQPVCILWPSLDQCVLDDQVWTSVYFLINSRPVSIWWRPLDQCAFNENLWTSVKLMTTYWPVCILIPIYGPVCSWWPLMDQCWFYDIDHLWTSVCCSAVV